MNIQCIVILAERDGDADGPLHSPGLRHCTLNKLLKYNSFWSCFRSGEVQILTWDQNCCYKLTHTKVALDRIRFFGNFSSHWFSFSSSSGFIPRSLSISWQDKMFEYFKWQTNNKILSEFYLLGRNSAFWAEIYLLQRGFEYSGDLKPDHL